MMNTTIFDRPHVRVRDVLSTDLHGETVLLSIERQNYYGLHATSRRIWQLLENPQTLPQLCDVLAREYTVDESTCRQEVTAFLAQLASQELIRPVTDR